MFAAPCKKSDVVLAKLAFGFAVDFQYAERRAVALENDVDRPAKPCSTSKSGVLANHTLAPADSGPNQKAVLR
jgi:hypothetical protein